MTPAIRRYLPLVATTAAVELKCFIHLLLSGRPLRRMWKQHFSLLQLFSVWLVLHAFFKNPVLEMEAFSRFSTSEVAANMADSC